ncbi:MAG: hypothetical protein D6813_05475 [Calditrichaeota bacterium]|nr:MAG: hypothetical protein D6813_05475 [Calditrichota bacterium]
MFNINCGKDKPLGPGGGSGNFSIQSGSPLTTDELKKALNLDKATSGLTNAAAQGNQQAANALIGIGIAGGSINTFLNYLTKGDLLNKLVNITSPTEEIPIDLGNGITLIVSRTQVNDPAEGYEMTWKLNGTCTENSDISFNDKQIADGFLSSTYRNGRFNYDFGDLFSASTCGLFNQGTEVIGTFLVEWAISSDGTTNIYVSFNIDQTTNVNGNTFTTDLTYEATITINSDGTGNAKGKIKGTAQGVNYDQSFDVSW